MSIINDIFLADIIREYSLSDNNLLEIIKKIEKSRLRKIMMMAEIEDLFSCTCNGCRNGSHTCENEAEFLICEICYDEVECFSNHHAYNESNMLFCESCGKLYCENCRTKGNVIIKECEDTGECVYFCNNDCLEKIRVNRPGLYKRFKE